MTDFYDCVQRFREPTGCEDDLIEAARKLHPSQHLVAAFLPEAEYFVRKILQNPTEAVFVLASNKNPNVRNRLLECFDEIPPAMKNRVINLISSWDDAVGHRAKEMKNV